MIFCADCEVLLNYKSKIGLQLFYAILRHLLMVGRSKAFLIVLERECKIIARHKELRNIYSKENYISI